MKNYGTVTIYMQVYNTKQYLEQCLNSVTLQTYTDWEFILVDNGCTDGSSEILKEFAAHDSRVHLTRFEENQQGFWIRLINKLATGTYFTVIDSDDWWEPDFLERLLTVLNENNLDLAITGTLAYIEATHTHNVMRKLEQPVYLSLTQFAQQYPIYWTFPSTNWGSILKMQLLQNTDFSGLVENPFPYGSDTMSMLRCIEQCTKIGIDNSALYHYRIHPKGVTYQYNPRRFDANIAYCEQIKEFLECHNTFDPPKQEWLKRVHLASMTATLELLRNAQITQAEKVTECARIAEHPLTSVALTNDCEEREQWRSVMWKIVFSILADGTCTDPEKLHSILRLLAPRCCEAVRPESFGLFARETSLFSTLRKDDWEQMVCQLLELIAQKRYSKQYDLGQMLGGLIPAQTPLEGMTDPRFFREYTDICMLVLNENYSAALEQMTGLLLGEKKLYAAEQFLELYLSLAALEEQVPAFLFGKFQLAKLYLRQNRLSKSRAIVVELEEMGLEDNEELSELRQALEERL